MGLLDELLKAQKPKRNLMDTQMVKGPDQPYLRQDYPTLYGALGGLLGTAPDEMAGSVMDPNTAAVRQGAEYGFPVGTALGVLPMTAPAQRGAMALGRAGERLAERAVPQVMNRGGLLAEMMQGMSNRTISPLDVYHGTPHTFPPTPRNPLGEFDASKIGTGEGAQTYGHGIYTSENPAVSMQYQPRDIKFESNIMRRYYAAEKQKNYPAMQVYEDFSTNKRPEEVLSYIQEAGYSPKDLKSALNAHKIASKEYANQTNSFLYKADLPDEKIAQMIDWDKPMAEQRNVIEKMRQALVGPDSPLSRPQQFQINDYLNDSVRMRNLYPQSVVDLNDPKIVERLRQVGIPGIKYLDEGSRAAGISKQTRNFVTFPGEEQNLKILERNSQKASDLLANPIPQQSTYPQQAALDLAQQRAALPVEQGGLGLPAGNTAEQRAAAMGGKDMVHFSRTGGDYTTLDSGKFAIAPFDAIGTHVGTPQAAMDRFRNTIATTDQIKGTTYPVTILGDRPLMNKNSMPWGEDELNAFLRKEGGHNWSDIQGGKMTYQDMNANLRKKLFEKQGYTSIPYYNEVEGKGSISYIVPPENIRSRFAAFDPFRRSAAIAATMGVAAPDLLANPIDEEELRRLQSGLLYAP